jgi:hypothetical protein
MAGTPFDENINAAYKAFTRTSSKTGRPLVTGFVVRNAKPVRASVVLAGDSIVMPERPPSLARKPSPPKTPATNAAPATALASAASSSSAGVEPPRKKVIQIVTRTNPPAAQLTASTTPTSTPGAAPGEGSPSPTAPAPAPAPAAQAPAVIATVATATTATTATPATSPAATTTHPAPTPTLTAPAAGTPTPPSPAIATATARASSSTAAEPTSGPGPATAVAGTKTTASDPGDTGSAKPGLLAAATAALNPPPLTVAAREVPATDSGPSSTPSAGRERETPAGLQGTILTTPSPAGHGLSAGVLLAMGGILMGAAAFLTVVVLKRLPHPSARGSLITQSMQKDAKRPS